MEIIIKGDAKEIAALVVGLQGRRFRDDSSRLNSREFGQIAAEAIRDMCANKSKISMLKHQPTDE